jgi:hypothetical protein
VQGYLGIDAFVTVYVNNIVDEALISTKQVEEVILEDLAVIGHKVGIAFE